MAYQPNHTLTLNKVFLWASPRSASTTFLKCMSFVPDAIGVHEPFFCLGGFCSPTDTPNSIFKKAFREIIAHMGGQAAVDNIEGGFDSRNATSLKWLQDKLEDHFPGKKIVFVKELSSSVLGLEEYIPTGFKHTFLIRHPYKVALGLMAMDKKTKGPFYDKVQEVFGEGGSLTFFSPLTSSFKVWEYVKEQFPESKPVIIDTDDLLNNPAAMLEKYCKAVGIPFSKSMLEWEAGDRICYQWMVPKEWLLIQRTPVNYDLHGNTFASTRFEKRYNKPLPTKDQFPPAWLPLLEEELKCYEKMYLDKARIKC